MKKLSVVLAILSFLALAQVGQAAELQKDWYVNLWAPAIFTYDEHGIPSLIGDGYFYDTPAGDYSPFQVADPYGNRLELKITLPDNAQNVMSQESLVIPFTTGLATGTRIAYFSIACGTNYDSSQMFLGLYRTRNDGTTETIWTQQQSGMVGSSGHIAENILAEGQFYFKLNVVPEPSSAACLITALGCLFGAFRWRRS